MSATGRSAGHADEAGATLLEMLVVVAILALAAGIAFPALEGAYERAAWSQSRFALLSDLRQARTLAITSGRPIAVAADRDGRGYRLGDRFVVLPASVSVRLDPDPVLFYPEGGSSGGSLSMARGANTWRVEVSPASGLLAVERPQ